MIAYIALAAAALADIYTSHRLFKRGGVELNPLVVKLFGKRPSLAAMFAVKALAAGVVVYFGGETGAAVAAIAWGVVALLNLRR